MPHDHEAASEAAERLKSISEEIQMIVGRIITALREERLPDDRDEVRLEELSRELNRLKQLQRPPLPDPRKEARDN
jgi:hypothetical protein